MGGCDLFASRGPLYSEGMTPKRKLSSLPEKIGARVKYLRVVHGQTQQALAEKSGLSTPTVSRIERGGQAPTVESLAAIAKALDTPLSSLFEFDTATTKKDAGPVRLMLDRLPVDASELRARLERALAVLAGEP